MYGFELMSVQTAKQILSCASIHSCFCKALTISISMRIVRAFVCITFVCITIKIETRLRKTHCSFLAHAAYRPEVYMFIHHGLKRRCAQHAFAFAPDRAPKPAKSDYHHRRLPSPGQHNLTPQFHLATPTPLTSRAPVMLCGRILMLRTHYPTQLVSAVRVLAFSGSVRFKQAMLTPDKCMKNWIFHEAS